jgi:oxalate decarboxylase/phosphoglucose isomerase-like protein (cupin superfamily)
MPYEQLRVGEDAITLHVTSAQTGGALLAAEVAMPAGGGPPMLHRHAATEIYRVESGELAVYLEDEGGAIARVPAGPGSVVHVPGGREHTIRNESGAEARAYVVFAPAAEMEAFVRAAARQDAPTVADVLALAARHGVALTRPVPAAQPA